MPILLDFSVHSLLSAGDQPFRSVKPNEVNISQFFVRYIKEDDVNCVYTMCGSPIAQLGEYCSANEEAMVSKRFFFAGLFAIA